MQLLEENGVCCCINQRWWDIIIWHLLCTLLGSQLRRGHHATFVDEYAARKMSFNLFPFKSLFEAVATVE